MVRHTWYIQGILILAFNLLVCMLPFLIGSLLKWALGEHVGWLNLLVGLGDVSMAVVGWVALAKMWSRSTAEKWGMAFLGSCPFLFNSFWVYRDAGHSGDALASMGEFALVPIIASVSVICFMVLFFSSQRIGQ